MQNLALTVLHLALTVLYVHNLALTVLYSLDSRSLLTPMRCGSVRVLDNAALLRGKCVDALDNPLFRAKREQLETF